MLELIGTIVILGCVIIVLCVVATYWYAESQSDKRYILKQEERINSLKNNEKELYAKLFLKQGMTPLGVQPVAKESKPERDRVIAPTVIDRRQAEDRTKSYITEAKKIIDG